MYAHGHGDDKRFAKLFRETWRQIPLRDRQSMLRHWRQDAQFPAIVGAKVLHPQRARQLDSRIAKGKRPRIYPSWYIPRIELLNGWSGKRVPNDVVPEAQHRGELAVVFARGHVLRFHGPAEAVI